MFEGGGLNQHSQVSTETEGQLQVDSGIMGDGGLGTAYHLTHEREACSNRTQNHIQVSAVRSIMRTANLRQCKRTAVAGCTVNAGDLNNCQSSALPSAHIQLESRF